MFDIFKSREQLLNKAIKDDLANTNIDIYKILGQLEMLRGHLSALNERRARLVRMLSEEEANEKPVD